MRFLCVVGDEVRSTIASSFGSGSGVTCEFVFSLEAAMTLVNQLASDQRLFDFIIVEDDLMGVDAIRLIADAKARSASIRSIILTSRSLLEVTTELDGYAITSKMMRKPITEYGFSDFMDIVRRG